MIINVREIMKVLIRIGVIGSLAFLTGYASAEPMTPSPTILKFNGLFMPISEKESNLYYLLLPGSTIVGEDARVKLDDEEFEKAIKETENHRIYQLRSRGGMLTHACIDLLKGQNELRYLDLSNNRLITDIACKKIAEYFPRLERLNLFNTSISDKGLDYLIDLTSLKQLHVAQSKVTWQAANVFRGKMQSVSGNEDLEITTGYHKPFLPSYNLSRRLRATYQTNVIAGKLNPNYKIQILKDPAKENKKYEDDLDKEKDGPIFNEE